MAYVADEDHSLADDEPLTVGEGNELSVLEQLQLEGRVYAKELLQLLRSIVAFVDGLWVAVNRDGDLVVALTRRFHARSLTSLVLRVPVSVVPNREVGYPEKALQIARGVSISFGITCFLKQDGGKMAGVYDHISSKIRDLRRGYGGQGLSQEALAEKLKTNANTVSRWETGTYRPDAEELARLAKVFGVPVTVFFPEEDTPDEKTQALLSALGDLDDEDREELITYAQYRKAKRALEQAHRGERPRIKR